MKPTVTVYVPVYNGAKYLREALDSIAAQTCADWECIVVDDCSTDESPAIEASYTDTRFRIVRQPFNLNVANASNLALRMARGRYLARLDQDDIAHPERLAWQVAYLDAHPDVAVCGGWLEVFGEQNGAYCLPADDGRIKANLLSGMNTIGNPASTVRVDFLREQRIMNDPRFPLSCDYGMWVDCTLAGGRFANLPQFVARYRSHGAQSSRKMDELVKGVVDAKLRLLHAWFPDLSHVEVLAAEPLLRANGQVVIEPAAARHGIEVCTRMLAPARSSVHGEDRDAVREFIAQRVDIWRAELEAFAGTA
jgi:glycosyltransferase involved in cell wall biosynthesis